MSSQNYMWVHFHSDDNYGGGGFKASYTSEYTGEFFQRVSTDAKRPSLQLTSVDRSSQQFFRSVIAIVSLVAIATNLCYETKFSENGHHYFQTGT